MTKYEAFNIALLELRRLREWEVLPVDHRCKELSALRIDAALKVIVGIDKVLQK